MNIGLDIGGTKCALSAGESEGGAIKILSREEFPTAGLSWQQVLEEFARRIDCIVSSNSNSNLQLKGTPVLAPLNGTFYRSDAPGKPEMAADGAAVKAGDAVCVVEAMKLFNPIKAPAAGKITFLVEHGKPVTKGQPVASIA